MDMETIEKAQKGDAQSFYELITERRELLYKTAYLYVKNEQDALDIVGETVYHAFRSIGKLKHPEYFTTWLVKILINQADENGNLLLDPDKAAPGYGTSATTYSIDEDSPGIYNGYLRLQAAEGFSYSGEIKLEVWDKDKAKRVWTFAIANTPSESKVYTHDAGLSFRLQTEEGQYPLHVGTVALYPMETVLPLTVLDTDIAPCVEQMYLEDEMGNRAAFKNTYTDANFSNKTVFESLYFHHPQELYLVIEELEHGRVLPEHMWGTIPDQTLPVYRLKERIRLY